MPDQLWRLLRDHTPDLRATWATNLKRMTKTKFASRPYDDLLTFTTECLAGYLALLKEGDQTRLREFIEQDARFRLRNGFRLSEVQQAYSEFKNVVWPLVSREFEDDNESLSDAIRRTDNCVSSAIFEFSELYQEETTSRLDQYLAQIETSNEFLRETAIRDSLTGSYSLIYFLERFEEELGRAQRYQRPLSVLFLDIDDFDQLNQEYGHIVGDVVLVNLAKLLQDRTRASDLVARYGGEEFVVAFPETDKDRATTAGDKLCRAIAAAPLWDEGRMGVGVNVTVSVGLASYPEDGQVGQELIELAEATMRRAKKKGKNRIELA